jgi:hypothetical protein
MLLCEIALVFGLQVHSPAYWELEFILCPLKHGDRLAVVHAHELRADDPLQFRHQAFLNTLVKEGEIFLALLQQIFEGELQ